MAERGGRYYAVRAEPQAYSTQTIQELRIQQLEQEIAVLKQRNADLTMCLDEAVALQGATSALEGFLYQR